MSDMIKAAINYAGNQESVVGPLTGLAVTNNTVDFRGPLFEAPSSRATKYTVDDNCKRSYD